MNCAEVLKHLNLFLDSECDREISLFISNHLENCPHCRRRLDKEIFIEKKFREWALRYPESDSNMWVRLEQNFVSPASSPSVRGGLFVPFFVAAIALVIISLSLWQFTVPKAEANFVEAVCMDFEKMAKNSLPSDLIMAPWETLGEMFDSKLPFRLKFTKNWPDAFKMQGARPCSICREKVLFLVGEIEGEKVTVCIFPSACLEKMSLGGAASLKESGELKLTMDRLNLHAINHSGIVLCCASQSKVSILQTLSKELHSRVVLLDAR